MKRGIHTSHASWRGALLELINGDDVRQIHESFPIGRPRVSLRPPPFGTCSLPGRRGVEECHPAFGGRQPDFARSSPPRPFIRGPDARYKSRRWKGRRLSCSIPPSLTPLRRCATPVRGQSTSATGRANGRVGSLAGLHPQSRLGWRTEAAILIRSTSWRPWSRA